MTSLEEKGLCIENVRGQGYDGASNMSSAKKGVQAVIRDTSLLIGTLVRQLHICIATPTS